MATLLLAMVVLLQEDKAATQANRLVEKLRSDSVVDREEASRHLSALTLKNPYEAVPVVQGATRSADAETRSRAGAILEELRVVEVGRGSCQVIRLRYAGKPVEGAMVALEGDGARDISPPAAQPIRVSIRDGSFSTRSLFVVPGSKVEIENGSAQNHAVYVKHVTGPFECFNTALDPGKRHAVTLAQSVRVSLSCNHTDHQAERVCLWVTDTRARGISGPHGTVIFMGVPPGRYTLRVWHEHRGDIAQKLEIGENATHDLEFGELLLTLAEDYKSFGLPVLPPQAQLAIQEPGGISVSNGIRQRSYHLVFLLEPATSERPARVFLSPRSRDYRGDHFRLVAPSAELLSTTTPAYAQAAFHVDPHLAMAVQCYERGWKELACALCDRALGQEPFTDDARAKMACLAWNYWCNALVEKDSDRGAIGKRLRMLLDSPHGFDTKENKKLLEDLALTLVPSKAPPGSVEFLIDDLVNLCPDTRFGNLYSGGHKSTDETSEFEPRYWRLWQRGIEAVPDLLKHLEDMRLVRHIESGFRINLDSRHSRVCHVVAEILRDLSCDRLKLQEKADHRGYSLDPAQAKSWWDAAQALGEEKYLLENVIPTTGLSEYGENTHLLHILAARYPRQLPVVYEITLDKWPQGHNAKSARHLENSLIPKDLKLTLFLKAARGSSRLHRLIALGPLLRLGHFDALTILVDTLRSLPTTPEGSYWTGEAGTTAALVTETDDPLAWTALEETARRVDLGQRMEMLERMTYSYSYPEIKRKGRRLTVLRGFLDDRSLRVIDESNKGKFDGPCAGFVFPRLRVCDVAAMEIASLLSIENDPDPLWKEAEWDELRNRASKALADR